MEVLTLKEAEQLERVLYKKNEQNHYLTEIQKLYFHGFSVCIPENILWNNFREMMQDLGIVD